VKKNDENAEKNKQTNLSGQLIGTVLPLAAPDKAIGLADPPEERQHQANSEVRHLVGQHVRRVGHANPLLSALLQVNLIHSHAEARHNLQLRQRLDQRSVRAGARVSDHRADGGGVLTRQLCRVGVIPRAEQLIALVELLLQVWHHVTHEEYPNRSHFAGEIGIWLG